MCQIFVSYRRSDAEDITGRICDRLAHRYGADKIFKDVDSIRPGADFRHAISKAIDASDVVLVVVGKQWLSSANERGERRLENSDDFVRWEIECALRKRSRLIPLLVQNAAMPQVDQLPESIQDLAFRNAIPIRPDPDFAQDMRKLQEAIRRIVGRDATEVPGRPRGALAIASLVAAALVGLAIWLWLRPEGGAANGAPHVATVEPPAPNPPGKPTTQKPPATGPQGTKRPGDVRVVNHHAPVDDKADGAAAPAEPASAEVKPLPEAMPRRVELTRLTCRETNDLDGLDQVVMFLEVDGSPYKSGVSYPDAHVGTPCKNLGKGDEWQLEIEVPFERELVVTFRDLAGVPSTLGQLRLTRENVSELNRTVEFSPGGLRRNHYTLEWRPLE
jgi:hypothetical protein